MPGELLLDDINAQAVSQNVIPSYYLQYFNVTKEYRLWGISKNVTSLMFVYITKIG